MKVLDEVLNCTLVGRNLCFIIYVLILSLLKAMAVFALTDWVVDWLLRKVAK